jgi:anaerobic magnesium-protoporphyrin IX monomethyl ester cyclase
MKRVLLIEPNGDFIRLDRCMQSIDSWGGAYRFPLNLARIGAHLNNIGCVVDFIDLQADKHANLKDKIHSFSPDLCILSCGFPSMKIDAHIAKEIKHVSNKIHISTFGVAPTLLKQSFFDFNTWGFEIPFDSIVLGGEPALGYEELISMSDIRDNVVIESSMNKVKSIDTQLARHLFNHSLYKSPFTGQNATYIEGTYGCPFRCNFCVVPVLYEGKFSKRTPKDIVKEFQYVIENDDVSQITLWDEGTTFQKSFIKELCDGLIELRKSKDERFRNFVWTTRSTTALLDEEIVDKMSRSGLSGITLGIESFSDVILDKVEKNVSVESNYEAIRLLKKYDIISIGHFILGHIQDTKQSIEHTIESAIKSDLNFAQFYCAVPYPGTKLYDMAMALNLIRQTDLTKYELSNPIMDTMNGVSHLQIGQYRKEALESFWTAERWQKIDTLLAKRGLPNNIRKDKLKKWASYTDLPIFNDNNPQIPHNLL